MGAVNSNPKISKALDSLVDGRLVMLFGNATAFLDVYFLFLVAIILSGLLCHETKNKEAFYFQVFTNLFSVFTDSRL